MNKVILDASALLALINNEPGAEIVEQYLPISIMSSVNVSEVAATLNAYKISKKKIQETITFLIHEVIPFDENQAFETAYLKETNKKYGLSLGDRACLSLAAVKKIPVVTADKVWTKIDLKIDIVLIR